MPPIEAVTFDFWDTIVRHGSDEPKRRALGVAPADAERRRLVREALAADAPIEEATVDLAWDVARAGFRATWERYAITWPLAQRLRVIADGLGRSPDDDAISGLVDRIGRMIVDVPPDPVQGIDTALETLGERYRLAVVSDAIVVPGAWLRRLLDELGLAHHFTTLAFSDEVGRAKPHRAIFEAAAKGLGVPVEGLVHVGDREHNDISGPQALGARAVLFTGAHGGRHGPTAADAVCSRHADLPAIVDRLAQAAGTPPPS